MRIALLADVHANLHALDAVLEDIARAGLDDAIVVLGDVVGYGGSPAECLSRLVSAGATVVAGNHDREVSSGVSAVSTNAPARQAQAWTRTVLDARELEWLGALPPRAIVGEQLVAVHGCFLNDEHTWGYVTSTMLHENLLRIAARSEWPRVGATGHTHVPLAGWLDGDHCVEVTPSGETVRWPERARAVLLNPGAVGQPRDGDPRASWAIVDLDARTMDVRRVPYDVEAAARAIRAAGLPEPLATRLFEGR